MKFSHLLVFGVGLAGLYFVGTGYMPWILTYLKYGLFAGSVLLLVYFSYDTIFEAGAGITSSLTGVGRKGKDYSTKISPAEAPEWLNEQLKDKSPYRQIELDPTNYDNTKIHTDTKGLHKQDEPTKFFIAGRPKNNEGGVVIAYICDLSEPEPAEAYSGQLHDSDERVKPFGGRYDWLNTPEYRRNVLENDRAQNVVNINDGRKNEVEDTRRDNR